MVPEEEDNDLATCWADIRPPKSPRTWAEASRLLNRTTGETPILVGLFTENGEVTGNGYQRIPCLLRVEDGGATILPSVIAFGTAGSSWGLVLSVGIFTPTGESLFYADLKSPPYIMTGDSMNLTDIRVLLGS